jgi:hypothetical protein
MFAYTSPRISFDTPGSCPISNTGAEDATGGGAVA